MIIDYFNKTIINAFPSGKNLFQSGVTKSKVVNIDGTLVSLTVTLSKIATNDLKVTQCNSVMVTFLQVFKKM